MKPQVQSPLNNDVVIPAGSARTTRGFYTGIIDAISQIQQYAVMEEDREIPDDFLTIKGKLSFLNVGCSHGFFEGLAFGLLSTMIIPILADEPLRLTVSRIAPVLGNTIFLRIINCLPIIIMGGICCYLSKYRIGNITRRAVDSFLAGRMISLFLKGIIIFSILAILSNKIDEHSAWKVATFITSSRYENAAAIYRILMNMKPYLLTAAWEILGIFFVATILPIVTVWVVTAYRLAKKRQEDRFWSS